MGEIFGNSKALVKAWPSPGLAVARFLFAFSFLPPYYD
jgi:hypothetical protein